MAKYLDTIIFCKLYAKQEKFSINYLGKACSLAR